MTRRLGGVLCTLLTTGLLAMLPQGVADATTVGTGEKLLLEHLAAASWYGSGTMHLSECTSPSSGCGPDRYPSADLVEQQSSFTIAPDAERDYYYTDGYNPGTSIASDGVLNEIADDDPVV